MKRDPSDIYLDIKKQCRGGVDLKHDKVRELFGELHRACLPVVSKLKRVSLVSKVAGKKYFAFKTSLGLSRAVNEALFTDSVDEWNKFEQALAKNSFDGFDSARITKIIYSVALCYFCYTETVKRRNQRSHGTFFEYLVGHLFAWRLGVNPKKALQVLNLDDLDATLPTDYTFNLGKDQPKFHLPIKTSTRERIIQVWAHQRVLDGVFGTGRFLGTPVILNETKTEEETGEVVEICLGDQWHIYQLHIAQLKRVYYLDIPEAYAALNHIFPPIPVRPFGDFFFEHASLLAP